MTYLTGGIQAKLRQAFGAYNMTLDVRSDHIIAKKSRDYADEKIRKIVELAGFSPILSKHKINNDFVFTIAPYKIPEFFNFKLDESPYLKLEEISSLLQRSAFVGIQETSMIDKWKDVNSFRKLVTSSLNKGISDLISKHVKDKNPIVEIGSGIGYSISDSFSSQTIRIQPSPSECQLLRQSISDPIYQLSIDGLHKSLIESGKKIPLFFALNVFDTMSTDQRKASLKQISELQVSGDRNLIMLDTNPHLDSTIKLLEELHPEHEVYPYYPLKNEFTKFSVIMVPLMFIESKHTADELVDLIEDESKRAAMGFVSQLQLGLHQLQQKFNLKVIALEDFFVEQLKGQLKETGYKADVCYHTSFTTGSLPKKMSGMNQDLLYKSVTDTATIRQWSLTDSNFVSGLAKKGLKVPDHFGEAFLLDLRKKGQKIFGAEILVIDAAKI